MPHVRLLPVLLVALVAFHVSAAWGAVVAVNPVRIHLSASRRSELLQLKNTGKELARFQITGNVWQEGSDGQMTLVPSRDIVFFPSLLEIKPGETRRIRIASSVAPGAAERSYRLIAQELPNGVETPGTVQVLTRLSIPVFVQPATPRPKAAVNARVERGKLVVAVENVGNAYFRTANVRVVGRSKSGAAVFEETLSGWYVLAGGRRVYTVELPKDRCMAIASVNVTATTEDGKSASTAATPSGSACQP